MLPLLHLHEQSQPFTLFSFIFFFFFVVVAWSLHRHMNLATTWVTRSSIASFTFIAVLALVS